MKNHAELTKRQLQVLPYLLSCPTYEEAARQANVSVKQIYCWLKTPTFRAELDSRRNEVIEETTDSNIPTGNHRYQLYEILPLWLVRYSLENWFLKMENIEPLD